MSEELRACHFEHHVIEGMGFVEPTNQDPHWYATCCDCGARGPGCGTRLIAIKSFNTRPLEAELVTALEEHGSDWCEEHCTLLKDGDHWEECEKISALLTRALTT